MQKEKLVNIIVVFMVIGIAIGFLFIALDKFKDQIDVESRTISNESITITGTTPSGKYTLDYNHTFKKCYRGFSVLRVDNVSGSQLIVEPGNYSTDSEGRIWNITGDMAGVSGLTDTGILVWKVTYKFDYSNSTACAGIEETIKASEEIPEWLSILMVLFIIAILLWILFKVIGVTKGGRPDDVAEI